MIDMDALEALVRRIVREEIAKREKPAATEILTVAEAAELARVTPGCVRRWIRAERLRSTGAGKLLRVRRADLDAMLRGGELDDDSAADEITARIMRRRAS